MATKQITVTIESLVTGIKIDPVGAQLYLQGALLVPDGEGGKQAYKTFTENVTALLDAEDIAAATRLATRAQAWIDAKLP